MLGTSPINSNHIYWQTPKSGHWGDASFGLKEILEWYKIELDVCAEDRLQSCCDHFLTEAETYEWPWDENWIMNPPWETEVLTEMIRRGLDQCITHHVTGVCILPSYTGTPWFHDLLYDAGATIIPIRGRMKYWKYGEPHPGSPNVDSILAVYNYARLEVK